MRFSRSSVVPLCKCGELASLDALVDAFAEEMKAKLREKAQGGYTGWDDPDWAVSERPLDPEDETVWQALHEHVGKGDPVDIANFAAFIWNAQGSGS